MYHLRKTLLLFFLSLEYMQVRSGNIDVSNNRNLSIVTIFDTIQYVSRWYVHVGNNLCHEKTQRSLYFQVLISIQNLKPNKIFKTVHSYQNNSCFTRKQIVSRINFKIEYGFPIEIKTKIRYLMICCYLIFIR